MWPARSFVGVSVIQGRSAAAILGRDREMTLLREALAATLAGRGRLVLISGEPGIGKSTLAAALSDEAARRGMRVSMARAPETTGAPPYWLWTQALRGDTRGGETAEQRPLASRHPILARILPELAALLGQPPTAPSTESDAERFRLADEIASLLLSSALEAPRVLVLDDLHAADASSLEVLAHVSSRLEAGRLLIAAAHRDAPADVAPALQGLLARVSRQHNTVRIPLAGFDVPVVRSQLAEIVGREVDVQLARQVHTRTGGNPFFVAEIGRLLVDDADGARSAAVVPPRVRDVIAWRLERLPEDTRDALQYAALIGHEVPVDMLAAACNRPSGSILAALEPAVGAAVVRQGRSPAWVRFAHALVAETIVEALPLGRAASLHERIAGAIEATRATNLEDWRPALAWHWSAAEPTERASRRAVVVARLAAEQAEARLAFDGAQPFWRMALEAAERAGAGIGDFAELRLGLARSLFRCGHVGEALDACRIAARDAEVAHRPELCAAAALVVEGVTEPQWASTLIALAEAALGKLPPDQLALQARLHAQIGQLVHLSPAADAEREQAETALAVELGERSGDRQALQAALQAHQFAMSGPDGVDERLRNAGRMIRIARDWGDAWPELWGRLWSVDALVQLGRLADADAQLDELDPVVERLHWPTARWHVLRSRAAILQARGKFEDALDSADRAHAELSGSGLERAALTRTNFLEGTSDLVGDVPGGEERRRRLRELAAREQGVYPRLIASLLREGDVDEARALYARLPPADRWDPPRYMLSLHLTNRLCAAVGLKLRDDAERLAARLEPLARWHVTLGAGTVITLGSGFLYTGIAAAFLGDLNRAVLDIQKAVDDNSRSGAMALALVARQELAEALARRRAGADLDHARRLASAVLREARRLGMRPFVVRASTLLNGMPRRRVKSERLTPRELEVARLLVDGLTNRQVAVRLGISEKTAENHVDNILSKLGFASRTQVAAWVASGAVEGNELLA
jgi:DNA-binding CsgD family transcriptional regulator